MFQVKADVTGAIRGLDQLQKAIRQAQDAATRSAARRVIVPAVKVAVAYRGGPAPIGQLGTRTGRLYRQVKAKFFRGKDGLLNGVVKVIGDRAFIARINESGAASHGRRGGPLPARRMFQTAGWSIRPTAEQHMQQVFAQDLAGRLGGLGRI
jgi:hypothetical protein